VEDVAHENREKYYALFVFVPCARMRSTTPFKVPWTDNQEDID